MMRIGFSTGNILDRDVRVGAALLSEENVDAIEISALREEELDRVLESLDSLPLAHFKYISFHAPSRLLLLRERELTRKLQVILKRNWPIIVHPDIIQDSDAWHEFGDLLCIENLDKRKSDGRTAKELERIFDILPQASLCFDIAHARQIDPTMAEATAILIKFGKRIRQIHISDLNSESKHEALTYGSLAAFRQLQAILPRDVPYIFESPVSIRNDISTSIQRLKELLITDS